MKEGLGERDLSRPLGEKLRPALGLGGLPAARAMPVLPVFLLCMAIFGFAFWGYPLKAVHFNTLHFLSKDPFPDFWGLHVVNSATNRVDWSFLYRNEGLMAAELYFFYQLPLTLESKLVLVNSVNLGVQLLNVGLFAYSARKLAGPLHLLPYLLLFMLYPFASSNHYWQANLPVNLAATFFLASLGLFLNVDYASGKVLRNFFLWTVPSLLCLWLSIIMVEYAICLSPLYVYLALYRENGRRSVWRFRRLLTPYTAVAGLFLLTSILPVFLFAGHHLTVASYASRFNELAQQTHLPEAMVKLLVMGGNGMFVALSYLFANTVGLVVYPVTQAAGGADYLTSMGATAWIVLGLLALAVGVVWRRTMLAGLASGGATEGPVNSRFLLVVGALWAGLSYFPFLLSVGYPRNVGLTVDRINALGSMGVVLVAGTALHLLLERHRFLSRPIGAATVSLVASLLLLNLQIQKVSYVEADWKERVLVEAVFQAHQQARTEWREPIFLLERGTKMLTPRERLRQALSEPTATAKLAGLGQFVWDRHFAGNSSSTSFNFDGIYFFWCCPATAQVTFNFYADWLGKPRPSVFKREGSFHFEEASDAYTIGYAAQEVWDRPGQPGEFHSYPKNRFQIVVMEIGEPTFHLGGPLTYTFKPIDGGGALPLTIGRGA